MNRRRFLKYAGATVAVAGASALGFDLFPKPKSSSTTGATSFTSPISLTSVSTVASSTKELATLRGRLFFDYNGNGKQEDNEPSISGGKVQLRNLLGSAVAEVATDSSGAFKIEDVPIGSYNLHPVADSKFSYMCRSPDEFVSIGEGYVISVSEGTTEFNIGLMEGFMTLPVAQSSSFTWDRYWDWDPDKTRFLWWNGNSGYNLQNNYRNGFNHASIDYGISEGQPILASIPGKVTNVSDFSSSKEVQCILLEHNYGFLTSYDHISRSLVKVGDSVSRGQKIAESGSTGDPGYPHLDSTLRIAGGRITLDPFHPIFSVDDAHSGYYEIVAVGVGGQWVPVPAKDNPAIQNYWTVYNKPQFAAKS